MTPKEATEMRELVARFFDAVGRGDIETVADLYDDDLIVWHNFDNVEKTKAENLASLASIPSRITDRSYEDRRVNVFDGGFVQQHVLHGTRVGDGQRLTMPAAIICQVKAGKITRLDEYLDSKDVAEFRKKF